MKAIRWVTAIIRLAVWVGIGSFVLLFAFSGVGSCIMKGQQPPNAIEAPWVIETESRLLYARSYSSANKSVTDVWVQGGNGKFQFIKGTLPVGKVISVVRRKP